MERQQRLLEELSRQPGVAGAALVGRDGLCVRAAGRPEMARETLGAMSATVLGAAEVALAPVEPSRVRYVVAQTEASKLLILGAGGDLLLLVLADEATAIDPLVALAQRAAGEVAAANVR